MCAPSTLHFTAANMVALCDQGCTLSTWHMANHLYKRELSLENLRRLLVAAQEQVDLKQEFQSVQPSGTSHTRIARVLYYWERVLEVCCLTTCSSNMLRVSLSIKEHPTAITVRSDVVTNDAFPNFTDSGIRMNVQDNKFVDWVKHQQKFLQQREKHWAEEACQDLTQALRGDRVNVTKYFARALGYPIDLFIAEKLLSIYVFDTFNKKCRFGVSQWRQADGSRWYFMIGYLEEGTDNDDSSDTDDDDSSDSDTCAKLSEGPAETKTLAETKPMETIDHIREIIHRDVLGENNTYTAEQKLKVLCCLHALEKSNTGYDSSKVANCLRLCVKDILSGKGPNHDPYAGHGRASNILSRIQEAVYDVLAREEGSYTHEQKIRVLGHMLALEKEQKISNVYGLLTCVKQITGKEVDLGTSSD